jgi:hypothetical protein
VFHTVCMTTRPSEPKPASPWQKTSAASLVRNPATETYYARVRIKGKLIWKSLAADAVAVAKLRLGDFLKPESHRVEITQAAARGKMNFAPVRRHGSGVKWV